MTADFILSHSKMNSTLFLSDLVERIYPINLAIKDTKDTA